MRAARTWVCKTNATNLSDTLKGKTMPPTQLAQASDRDQIINFLLARGDERQKTIDELTQALDVQARTIGELQKKIAALQPPDQGAGAALPQQTQDVQAPSPAAATAESN